MLLYIYKVALRIRGQASEVGMNGAKPMRWPQSLMFSAAFVALVVIAVVSVAWAPAMAAVACPGCYGLERMTRDILVDAKMPEHKRRALLNSVAAAEDSVIGFFGTLNRRPIVLACEEEICDRRLGGRGARATTYSTWRFSVVRLSPQGLNKMIIAHEFSHVQIHAKIGLFNQLRGVVPAWFDEGLAVIISDDDRYLKPGTSSAVRCRPTPEAQLPVSPFDWGPLSGKTPWIYAAAACRVLLWMEANGGRLGLLAAVDEVAAGRRALP